jgi:bifunctional non-homologous end joining protein LigD
VLDGEAVVLTEQGIPSFNRVLHRDLQRKAGRHTISANPVIYVVFDLIYYNGRYLTDIPLVERQRMLADIIKPSGDIILCDSYPKGEELFRIMDEKGMEGIVAKEKTGLYHKGVKNRTWLKIKCFRKVKAVIGGIVLKKGVVSALLLGLYSEDGKCGGSGLDYIGRVSTGLRESHIIQLLGIIQKYKQDQSAFLIPPKPEKDTTNVWLPPYLTANIQYLEWSDKGVLRNPVLLGFEI